MTWLLYVWLVASMVIASLLAKKFLGRESRDSYPMRVAVWTILVFLGGLLAAFALLCAYCLLTMKS